MALAKVFRIELKGSADVETGAKKVTASFQQMQQVVKAAKAELERFISAGETTKVKELTARIKELETQLKALERQSKLSDAQSKQQALAEKALADARLKEAQTIKVLQQAENERLKNQVQQEKELQRLIDLEDKEARALQNQKKYADALPGSYNAIRNAIAQLRPLIQNANNASIINFQGEDISFAQAIEQFRQLAFAEQDFRRQFQKDGTLVGEYTTGIIQAFQRLNIDDIIRNNLTGAKSELQALQARTNELVTAYRNAQTAGTSDLNKLEKEIHDNVLETQRLSSSIQQAEAQLRGMGGIGSTVTNGIKQSFSNLKNDIGSFIIGFAGFQAVYTGLQQAFDKTIDLSGIDRAMKVVSGTERELSINQEFLRQSTERLGLEYTSTTEAFNNFYAAGTQAGLSAATTRQIFEDVGSAAANMNLNQEKVNGVLLAFGQIASKGKVQAEELRGQIGERLPGAFALAAKAMGVTQTELNKMMDNGELLANEFLPKFAAELNKAFGVNQEQRIESLQARINRFKNEFTQTIQDNRAAIELIITSALKLGSAFLSILSYLPQIAVALGLLALGWAANNTNLVVLNAQLLIYNIRIAASYIAMGLLSAAQLALNGVTLIFSATLRGVTAAMRLFGIATATATGPLGIVLTAITLLGAAALGLSKAFGTMESQIDAQTRKTRLLADVYQEANKNTAEQRSRVTSLVAAVKELNGSHEAQLKVMQQLINIDPIFQKALIDGKVNVEKLNEAMKEYNATLLQRATREAASARSQKEFLELERLVSVRQQLTERKTGALPNRFDKLSEDEISFLPNGIGSAKSFRGLSTLVGTPLSQRELEKGLANVDKAIEAQRKVVETANNSFADILKTENAATDTTGPAGRTIKIIEADLKKANEDWENAIVGSKDKAELKKKIDALQKELDAARGKQTENNQRASRLTAQQKDDFKDIDANTAELKARLEKAFIETDDFIRSDRSRVLVDTEKTYLTELYRINESALNQKLALLTGKNAEERKRISEMNLEKVKLQQEYNNQLFALDNQELQRKKDMQELRAKIDLEAITDNPELLTGRRLEITEEYYRQQLAQTLVYNEQQRQLELKYNIKSEENEKKRVDAVLALRQKLRDLSKEIIGAELEDIKDVAAKQISEYNSNYAKLRIKVIENDRLTASQRRKELERLSKLQNFTILSAELAQLNIEVAQKKKLLDAGLLSSADYLSAVERQNKKAEELALARKALKVSEIEIPNSDTLQKQLSEKLSASFGFTEGSGEDKLLGAVIAQSFDLATEAMNSFFDAQTERINQEKQQQLEFLDREEKRRLARATSADEEDTINRQFDQKRRNAEREAGERLKKVKRAEARIALSTELANIAVAAAANPANAFTFGAAGIAMYSVLAALAFGRYALRVGEINRQQFAYGGMPKGGGVIAGRSHRDGGTPFVFKGAGYEAEAGELAIIRTRNAPANKVYTIRGTQMQIASKINEIGGGRPFAYGGRLTKFASGGLLGTSLQAPTFPSTYSSQVLTMNQDDSLGELKEMIVNIAAAVVATDKKEVVLNPNKVTQAQNRTTKDISLASL